MVYDIILLESNLSWSDDLVIRIVLQKSIDVKQNCLLAAEDVLCVRGCVATL